MGAPSLVFSFFLRISLSGVQGHIAAVESVRIYYGNKCKDSRGEYPPGGSESLIGVTGSQESLKKMPIRLRTKHCKIVDLVSLEVGTSNPVFFSPDATTQIGEAARFR